jgi:hypothetical protein
MKRRPKMTAVQPEQRLTCFLKHGPKLAADVTTRSA